MNEVLQYVTTGDEALLFAILDNPGEIAHAARSGWVKSNFATTEPRRIGLLFELLQNLKHQPQIELLLLELIEDRSFQHWKGACDALFYNRSDDSLFDRRAVGDRLRRNELVDRARYWEKIEE